MKKVTLEITWDDLFPKEFPLQRKERWEEWKRIALQSGRPIQQVECYECTEGCDGCMHLVDGAWCGLVELPCGLNPVLNMLGMACCGAGKVLLEPELFEDSTENVF